MCRWIRAPCTRDWPHFSCPKRLRSFNSKASPWSRRRPCIATPPRGVYITSSVSRGSTKELSIERSKTLLFEDFPENSGAARRCSDRTTTPERLLLPRVEPAYMFYQHRLRV